jgi:hypothetical protein
MPVAVILALAQAGASVAQGLIKNDQINKWIELGKLAAQGVASAVAAIEQLTAWQKSGYAPTNAELDAVYADSVAAHDKVQNA